MRPVVERGDFKEGQLDREQGGDEAQGLKGDDACEEDGAAGREGVLPVAGEKEEGHFVAADVSTYIYVFVWAVHRGRRLTLHEACTTPRRGRR